MFIRRWIERLFPSQPPPAPQRPVQKRPAHWPTKEQIANLPPFDALKLHDILNVNSPHAAAAALQEIALETVVGFDTESKPTFRKGDVSTGPHTVQFATTRKAYVFVLHDPECRKAAGALIAMAGLKKVGFGLHDDLRRIRAKLRVEPQSVLDLETLFREKGFGRGVGVRVGLALLFKKRFLKSRKASTSNWSHPNLTPSQILYAGNDAFAAISAYHALAAFKKRG